MCLHLHSDARIRKSQPWFGSLHAWFAYDYTYILLDNTSVTRLGVGWVDSYDMGTCGLEMVYPGVLISGLDFYGSACRVHASISLCMSVCGNEGEMNGQLSDNGWFGIWAAACIIGWLGWVGSGWTS